MLMLTTSSAHCFNSSRHYNSSRVNETAPLYIDHPFMPRLDGRRAFGAREWRKAIAAFRAQERDLLRIKRDDPERFFELSRMPAADL